ncbi:MAG: Nif11-like leader peptide family natural product precursor [Peptococcaceae bacterium]|nr:Nif11-like leader peptide family natural product precursor [Peptococcaceae bacterium]
MSAEDLKRFMQFLAENEEAAGKVKEIGVDNLDAIVAYGKELGYEFDRQELEELRSKVAELYKARIKKNLEKAAAQVKEQRPGMQNLNRFVQLVGENAEIAQKVQEISFDDPKGIIAYAGELGFEFDERDLEEFGNRMLEQSDELSEEELEQVAGGAAPVIAVFLASAAVVGVSAVAVVGGVAGAAVGMAALVGKHL